MNTPAFLRTPEPYEKTLEELARSWLAKAPSTLPRIHRDPDAMECSVESLKELLRFVINQDRAGVYGPRNCAYTAMATQWIEKNWRSLRMVDVDNISREDCVGSLAELLATQANP